LRDGAVCGFEVSGHGESVVCAAVSMLCINAVNSLETLTGCLMEYEYEPKGGYIRCVVVGEIGCCARVLLDSLTLGLSSVESNYGLKLIRKEI